MAGSNQVWTVDVNNGTMELLAGTGAFGASDGESAEFAQPTGLAIDGSDLVVADSSSSSIRRISDSTTSTAAGPSGELFEYGDENGAPTDARFQFPLDLAVSGSDIWVVDSLNHRIRRVSPAGVDTVAGSVAGWQDGSEALFAHPSAIDVGTSHAYVADTGNHSIRRIDLVTGETSTIVLRGIELLVPTSEDQPFEGVEIRLDPATVQPGAGSLVLDVSLPDGFKINPLAPSRFEWLNSSVATVDPAASQSIVDPAFPMEVNATFAEGAGEVKADLWLVYCESDQESICLFDRARVTIPLEVTPQATGTTVPIDYTIVLPEL
jgi:hypothetical protein